jgi:hypothetical protein
MPSPQAGNRWAATGCDTSLDGPRPDRAIAFLTPRTITSAPDGPLGILCSVVHRHLVGVDDRNPLQCRILVTGEMSFAFVFLSENLGERPTPAGYSWRPRDGSCHLLAARAASRRSRGPRAGQTYDSVAVPARVG